MSLLDSIPSWVASNTGMGYVRVDMFQARSSDRQVIAASHGRSVFSSNAFSWPVATAASIASNFLNVCFNSAKDIFTMAINNNELKTIFVALIHLHGKLVFNKQFALTGITNKISVEPVDISSGVYLLSIIDENKFYKFSKLQID